MSEANRIEPEGLDHRGGSSREARRDSDATRNASGGRVSPPSGATEPGKLPLCASIRAKGFFVFTEETPPPVETDTAVWWCVRTMTSIGPDGEAVHRQCCGASRACFEGPPD
ncbi:hypothetical protein HY251_17750 [bacterium]|nr:hypothetical protein [bacterium]